MKRHHPNAQDGQPAANGTGPISSSPLTRQLSQATGSGSSGLVSHAAAQPSSNGSSADDSAGESTVSSPPLMSASSSKQAMNGTHAYAQYYNAHSEYGHSGESHSRVPSGLASSTSSAASSVGDVSGYGSDGRHSFQADSSLFSVGSSSKLYPHQPYGSRPPSPPMGHSALDVPLSSSVSRSSRHSMNGSSRKAGLLDDVGPRARLATSVSSAPTGVFALLTRSLHPYVLPAYIPVPFTQQRRVLKLLLPAPLARATLRMSGGGARKDSMNKDYLHHRPFAANGGPVYPRTPRQRLIARLKSWAYIILIILLLVFFIKRLRSSHRFQNMNLPFQGEPSTLVMDRQDIARIWAWEIQKGQYPSRRRMPPFVALALANTSVVVAGAAHAQAQRLTNPSLPRVINDDDAFGSRSKDNSVQTSDVNRTPQKIVEHHSIQPVGPTRQYIDIVTSAQEKKSLLASAYPPRPTLDSILDLDIVMDYCDFSTNQYVRDCLEILRAGGQLDPHKQIRRGQAKAWRHIYTEEADLEQELTDALDEHDDRESAETYEPDDIMASLGHIAPFSHTSITRLKRPLAKDTDAPVELPRHPKRRRVGFGIDAKPHPTHPTADPMCDPDNPRIFHVFWAGPFTDKPYAALLSFLFTQNLGLHIPHPSSAKYRSDEEKYAHEREDFLSRVCRPQMWIWINPGPAASVPNPAAKSQMLASLKSNPWSAPFLHPRFSDVIRFQLWNTTEQLDGIPELRSSWRRLQLFNSGGVKYGSSPTTPEKVAVQEEDEADAVIDVKMSDREDVQEGEDVQVEYKDNTTSGASSKIAVKKSGEDELFERLGSASSSDYDRLTVVLSDMARFVLCHRFGGVYLDADTLLLRDWEEIWGWRGNFAYRWSRLEKYNTAVLKLGRNSALGSFLFKSALANGLDFHPMTISRYTKDASVEELLLRLPDALFDPAWLNTEYFQRDRPVFPYLKRFEEFFDPPKDSNAAPIIVGFDGFFRGAYSSHYHNFWWLPFDASRNWPDLGARFRSSERSAREKALAARKASVAGQDVKPGAVNSSLTPPTFTEQELYDDDVTKDDRDLSWSAVIKRTFEAFVRGDRPSAYGEYLNWGDNEDLDDE
ncbi:uncharacterized protein L969DRAFT_88982 [Mixia osmundae IAM 14324]|uniref:Glycosyltransferase family 32 protein n=1 Tax=Mixia osmundae (strain CBS 9802 / IAM 14324 / JCM 22182 / KY 12970) TaxID=764103 RepID=G7E7Y1_MIXOS|nr:uncharacterized protein L969DRAFT_88982 [Mixia osmundae IAM 14324]KEI38541.1 hypothetical protein L969DRAFT_88982 [Mixia osmundae IAM 14324]GAA98941.1 hypothetical protein E5Q_05629 [Mixia osmundae IAM 14324]